MASVARAESTYKVLGTFGKGLEGSISVNFDVSGGANCDLACPHHPASTAEGATQACYAVRTEIRPDRRQLKEKLERHGQMPAWLVCGKALAELSHRVCQGKPVPWVRISTNGSVPSPAVARSDRRFRAMFRQLLEFCHKNRIPVHLPVETYAKARFYRMLVGDIVAVRESAIDQQRFIRAAGPVSFVAGTRGTSRKQRVEDARAAASKRRRKTGRKTIVCPAVLNSWAANRNKRNSIPANPRAKCGACVACSLADVDVVYPLH